MAASSELHFKKSKAKFGTPAHPQEAKPNIQEEAYISALKGDLDAFNKEKPEDLHQPGAGMVRLEGLPVMSFVATFVVGSSESSSSQSVKKYQVKLTCGVGYPAKPPSVDWQDCPEPKPNLEHIPSLTNWNGKDPKPKLADVLTELENVIVRDHETKKKAFEEKKNSKTTSKGKKKSGGDANK